MLSVVLTSFQVLVLEEVEVQRQLALEAGHGPPSPRHLHGRFSCIQHHHDGTHAKSSQDMLRLTVPPKKVELHGRDAQRRSDTKFYYGGARIWVLS